MSNAKFIIQGGVQRGTEALPAAVNFLKQARAIGQTQLNKTFFFGDIKVRVVLDPYAGDRVYIDVPECSVMVSGMMDMFRSPADQAHFVELQIEKEHRDASILDHKLLYGVRPIPKTAVVVNGTQGDGPPNDSAADGSVYTDSQSKNIYLRVDGSWVLVETGGSDSLRLTTLLPQQKTVTNNNELEIERSAFKETYDRLYPSRFSGFMRGVMQMTLASPSWTGLSSVGGVPAKVPVNYIFGDSWGCVKNNGAFHFVRITNTAVYFVPAEYCIHPIKTDFVGNKTIPILKSVYESRSIKLLDLPENLGVSIDNETGWAFSYGIPSNEAAIVMFTDGVAGGMAVKFTELVKVNFGFDAVGNLTSAVLTRGEKTPFFAPYCMKPIYPSSRSLFCRASVVSGVRQNVTVDFGLDKPGDIPAGKSNPSLEKSPVVHVFYSDSGPKLTVFTSKIKAGDLNIVDRVTSTTATSAAGATVTDYSPLKEQTSWGTQLNTQDKYVYGFSCDGSSFPESESANAVDKFELQNESEVAPREGSTGARYIDWSASFTFYPDDPLVPPSDVGVLVNGQILSGERNFTVDEVHTVSTEGNIDAHTVMLLPVDDREAVVMYHSRLQSAFSRSETITKYTGTQVVSKYTYSTHGTLSASAEADIAAIELSCGAGGFYKARGTSETTHTASSEYVSTFVSRPAGLNWVGVGLKYDWNVENKNSCGYVSVSPSVTSTNVVVPAQIVSTSDQPAVFDESIIAYGHNTVSLKVGSSVVHTVHPFPDPLVCVFTQASFNPENYITHKTSMNGVLVAKFGDTSYNGASYDIENRLSGWIGVA